MELLETYLGQIATSLLAVPQRPLAAIGQALWETYERDGTIFVCGNGGSAATASHFACDLGKWTAHSGCRRVRALALTDNLPTITAWSNDQNYSDIFIEQLRAHYRPGDMLVAISGSGNSPNVLRAIEWANQNDAATVGLVGFDGGALATMARYVLHIDNYVMPQVEDIHMALCHALAVNLGAQIEQLLLMPTPQLIEITV